MKLAMKIVTPQDCLVNGWYKVLYPVYLSDLEKYESIQGKEVYCEIKQARNLQFHKKLFAIANCCIDNGILDKIEIKKEVIEALKRQLKSEVEVLVYIAKFLFLPMEIETLPDGKTYEKVSSISFEKMDNIEFTEFYKQFINWCSGALGIEADVLQGQVGNYI